MFQKWVVGILIYLTKSSGNFVERKIEESVDNFEHADKAESHAEAQKTGGRRNEGQGGHAFATTDLRVKRILDEHLQNEDVGFGVVKQKLGNVVGVGHRDGHVGIDGVSAQSLLFVNVENVCTLWSVGGFENDFSFRLFANLDEFLNDVAIVDAICNQHFLSILSGWGGFSQTLNHDFIENVILPIP